MAPQEACSSLDHLRHQDLRPGQAVSATRPRASPAGSEPSMARSTFIAPLATNFSSSFWHFLPSIARRLGDDATRRKVRLAGWAVSRGVAPAIRSDRAPPRFGAGEPPAARDELAIGQRWRRLAGDVAIESVARVALCDMPPQALMDDPWTEDQQVVSPR